MVVLQENKLPKVYRATINSMSRIAVMLRLNQNIQKAAWSLLQDRNLYELWKHHRYHHYVLFFLLIWNSLQALTFSFYVFSTYRLRYDQNFSFIRCISTKTEKTVNYSHAGATLSSWEEVPHILVGYSWFIFYFSFLGVFCVRAFDFTDCREACFVLCLFAVNN